MKKKIMIKTENGITSLRVYIQNPNGEFVSMSGGLNNLVSENIENVNKDNFVRLDLTKNTVMNFINNLLYHENIDNILEVWYDKSLINKAYTVAYPNGLLYKIEIKEKHVLPETNKTLDTETIVLTLKDVLNNNCVNPTNGCLVGKFNYNVTDVVYKKGIDPVLHKHMEDALDDLIGNGLAYSIPFNSELDYILVIVDDTHYLFDFDSGLNFKKKLYKKISKCFSNGERVRVYHIKLSTTSNVLNLLNLDTGNNDYFDIDSIKSEVDGECGCTSCTEEHVEPSYENKKFVLCESSNNFKFFESMKEMSDYANSNGIGLFRINSRVNHNVKRVLKHCYGKLINYTKQNQNDKVTFMFTLDYIKHLEDLKILTEWNRVAFKPIN